MLVTSRIDSRPDREPDYRQINIENWLDALYDAQPLETPTRVVRPARSKGYYSTTTMPREVGRDRPIGYIINGLEAIHLRIKTMVETHGVDLDNLSEQYTTFHIPKHSGGYREINAPSDVLKDCMRDIKKILEQDLKVLAHNNAYAYVQGRCPKDALLEHQDNLSNWFLKLDIKNFFPSFNARLIEKQLSKVYPFAVLYHAPTANLALIVEARRYLRELINLCLLNNELPQGTPLSPFITNTCMIPFDYEMNKLCRTSNGNAHPHYVYTRYADDLLISNRMKFDYRAMIDTVQGVLDQEEYTFRINTDKTRFGSNAGRNWNLGLMYNKDHNISVGHKKKEQFRASLHNFLRDWTSGNRWSKIDTQVLLGHITYYSSIEPEYVELAIQKAEQKNQRVNLRAAIKTIVRED